MTSITLGLDHPTSPSFQQVQDGFGYTLGCERDFLERMVTRKRSYTSSSSAQFPPPTQGSRRKKHLLMSLIELLQETIKEIQTYEGENYISQMLMLVSNVLI